MPEEAQQVYFARQPVFDRQMKTVAWELLHRSGPDKQSMEGDGSTATAQVLVHLLCDFNLRDVLENLPAFVNFPPELLTNPPDIDRKKCIIEVDAQCRDTAGMQDTIVDMWADGYRFSLDNYIPESPFSAIVQRMPYVRLNLRELGQDGLQKAILSLGRFHGQIIAEKIETHEEFEFCRAAGAQLFQGYFLCRPVIKGSGRIPESKLVVLRLLDEIGKPECSIEGIRNILVRDPKLSYTLLRLVNSANFRRAAEIRSIQHALTVLGLSKLRSWITLIALCNLNDKPAALQITAMYRARMCELLAENIEFGDMELMFTAGLFSLLDAFFDRPMSDLLDMLHLSGALRDALENGPSIESSLLRFVINYEQGEWDAEVWQQLRDAGVTPEQVSQNYLDATRWAIETTRDLLR